MNEEYNNKSVGGKGFYIALMLCVSVIALAAWMIVRQPQEPVQAKAESTPEVRLPVATTPSPSPVPVVETVPPVEDSVLQPVEAPVADEEPVQQVSVDSQSVTAVAEYVWPVVGPASPNYSMDKLVYNVTMGDWRTHDGIDIQAEVGAMVRAAASGQVEEVYDDDLYGRTVVIRHGEGLYGYYACLQADTRVMPGDWVLVGDVIGAVGDTALCESAQPPHLHFAMSLGGASINPCDYLPV